MASRDPNSDSVDYFPAAGLHITSEADKARVVGERRVRSSVFLSPLNHDLSARLHPDLGIIGHLSAQPFDDEGARTARRLRTYSQCASGRPWFG